jgi:hypothetical protein
VLRCVTVHYKYLPNMLSATVDDLEILKIIYCACERLETNRCSEDDHTTRTSLCRVGHCLSLLLGSGNSP